MNNQVIIITGVSSGFGRATAETPAHQGAYHVRDGS
jgi:NAD(P)-dependent dehydrogenase (short-subunit alcohol dehydrogenase family)